MTAREHSHINWFIIFISFSLTLIIYTPGFTAEKNKDKKKSIVIKEIELQSSADELCRPVCQYSFAGI